MRAARALRRVVFPVCGPPESGCSVAPRRRRSCSASAGVRAPTSTRSSGVSRARKLPHRQRRSGDGARREHRGTTGSVPSRASRSVGGRRFRPRSARDVLDRDGQVSAVRACGPAHIRASRHARRTPVHARVDHDLRDPRIPEQIVDRFQKRQDAIQAAHELPSRDMIEVNVCTSR